MSKRMRGNLFWYLFLLIEIYNGFRTKTRQNEDFCCLTSNSREPSVLKIETLSRTHAVCIHTLWLRLKLIVSLSHSHVLGVPFNQRFELILPIAFCKYASLFFFVLAVKTMWKTKIRVAFLSWNLLKSLDFGYAFAHSRSLALYFYAQVQISYIPVSLRRR